MKKIISIGTLGSLILLIWNLFTMTSVVSTETMTVPLQSSGNQVFTAEFVHIPLLINGVSLDLSIKANTYLKVWCELKIGDFNFKFTLNDLSLEYNFEKDNFEFDGKISSQGLGYFKASIDTDGFIEGIPKLIINYNTLDL